VEKGIWHFFQEKGASVAIFTTDRKLVAIIYRVLRYGHNYVESLQEAISEIKTQKHENNFKIHRL